MLDHPRLNAPPVRIRVVTHKDVEVESGCNNFTASDGFPVGHVARRAIKAR